MNNIMFFSENREYIIEINKEKRFFSYSKYGQYKCNLRFANYIGQIVLDIECNEKQLLDLMCVLDDMNMNAGGYMLDAIAYLNDEYFMYVAFIEEPVDYPIEEDPKISIQIFQNTINGQVSRLYLEMSLYYLEEFIYNIYQILEDIPYLNEMQHSSLLELMGEYE